MSSREFFRSYLLHDNPGSTKSRKTHVAKNFPHIIEEIQSHCNDHGITPIDFNDSLKYWLYNIDNQSKCAVCGVNIRSTSTYCSAKCKKMDAAAILDLS